MYKELHYDEIRVSEGTGVNKKKTPKECTICIHWCLSDKRFAFQATVYNDCQDVFIMSVDIKRITSLSIYDIDYRCSKLLRVKP